MAWTIEFDARAIKDLQRLERSEQLRIQRYLYDRVATAALPRALGKALVGPKFGQLWRYRIGDYRVVCQIDDGRVLVLVLEVGHRRKIYR